MNVYTYKYLYTKKDIDGIQCSVITGTDSDHSRFIEQLVSSEDIELALREYVCTYDVAKFGMTEKIKIKEDIQNEKKISN